MIKICVCQQEQAFHPAVAGQVPAFAGQIPAVAGLVPRLREGKVVFFMVIWLLIIKGQMYQISFTNMAMRW